MAKTRFGLFDFGKNDDFGQNMHNFGPKKSDRILLSRRPTFHEKIAEFEKKDPTGAKELGALGPVFGPHVPLCGARIRVTKCQVCFDAPCVSYTLVTGP